MSLLEAKQLFCELFSNITPLDYSDTLPIMSVFIYHVAYKVRLKFSDKLKAYQKFDTLFF